MVTKKIDSLTNITSERITREPSTEERETLWNLTRVFVDFIYKQEFVEGDNLYIKSLLRVKEDELSVMDNQLESARINIKVLANKLDDKSEVKNIYITEISSELTTNDVMTNIKKDSLGNLSLGIRDTNQIYSIETESWFKLTPYNDSLRIELVDKFGLDKSSQLKHKLNFSLTLSQIEMSDGLTRVIVQPTDKYGQIIPPNILQIPFVNGVEFMDVKPNIIPPPPPIKKRRGFGMLIGPSYGLYNINGTFQPTWGIGISVGYKIF